MFCAAVVDSILPFVCYTALRKKIKICLQILWCLLSHLTLVISSLCACLHSFSSSHCDLRALFSWIDSVSHHFHWEQNIRLMGNASTGCEPQTSTSRVLLFSLDYAEYTKRSARHTVASSESIERTWM